LEACGALNKKGARILGRLLLKEEIYELNGKEGFSLDLHSNTRKLEKMF